MPKKSDFLRVPVEPFTVEPDLTAEEILARMERISFQGRNLATAHRIWQKMLADEVLIFLGTAGALSAGGLRLTIAHLIANRYVDCLVSTGANLYHDLHDTRGHRHFLGSPRVDDAALQAEHIDRVYDTFVSEDEFIENDNWIADSSIGMGLSQARHVVPGAGQIDVIGDIVESANLVIRRQPTASVVVGGGTPKNFINQASVQAAFYRSGIGGHRYALQIVTDVPHFGGASGSTLDEAQSWGKVASDADRVTVNADATIALPLLASALASSARECLAARRPAAFDLAGRIMAVDGVPFPDVRFDAR